MASTNKVNRFKPLRDAVFVGLIVSMIVAGFGYQNYSISFTAAQNDLQNNLKVLSLAAANLVDIKLFKTITKPEQKDSPDYKKLTDPFYKLLAADSRIAFIYTTVVKQDGVYFILDAQVIKPGEKDERSDVMERYADYPAILLQASVQKSVVISDEPYSDSYGTFLSGYAPVIEGDDVVAVVGVDIRLDSFLEKMSMIRLLFYASIVLSILFGLFAGVLVYKVRKV